MLHTLDRLARPGAVAAVGILIALAGLGMTTALHAQTGRTRDAEAGLTATTQQLTATASQAGDLAAQVKAACAAGGPGADRLRKVPAGPGVTLDACARAAAVAATPAVAAAGPTTTQLAGAVAGYLAVHPLPPGQTGPTTADVTVAIADYLAAHPATGRDGPSAAQLSAAVSTYLTEHPPAAGAPGPAPTQAAIASAVAAYMNDHPPALCGAGEHRRPVRYAGGETGSGCVSDDQSPAGDGPSTSAGDSPAPTTSAPPPASSPAHPPPDPPAGAPAPPTR